MSRETRNDRQAGRSSPPLPFGTLVLAGILVLYLLIPNYLPAFGTLDTTTVKFLGTAGVNFLLFGYLLFRKGFSSVSRQARELLGTWPGLAISGLLLVTLLSFTKSTDAVESVLETARFLTVVSAAVLIGAAVSHDVRVIRVLVLAALPLLILDGMMTWVGLRDYITLKAGSVTEIKFVYSNKNIYSATLFLKLPAAIYAIFYERRLIRWVGVAALFAGTTGLLILSARTFYLGLIFASLLLATYVLTRRPAQRSPEYARALTTYFLVLALAAAGFSAVQAAFYPDAARESLNVGARLGTVAQMGDASNRARLDAWHWSLQLMHENPGLGVGVGNWRIAALEHENQGSPHYFYMYRAHNDFLETAADRGLLGGAFFLGIFLAVLALAVRSMRRSTVQVEVYRGSLLAALGVLFYAVDAFFNFPADRAETTAAFAIFVGIAMGIQNRDDPPLRGRGRSLDLAVGTAVGIALVASALVLHSAVVSSRAQQAAYSAIGAERLDQPAAALIARFPRIPALTHFAESVSTVKGRLLMMEKRHLEAIDLMKADTRHPFDGRREAFIAENYLRLEMYDSARHYVDRARAIKPLFYGTLNILVAILEEEKQYAAIDSVLGELIERDPSNPNAWIARAKNSINLQQHERATELIDRALLLFPESPEVRENAAGVRSVAVIRDYKPVLDEALRFYRAGDHARALPYFDQYLTGVPHDSYVHGQRAVSRFLVGDYRGSLSDIERARVLGTWDPGLVNLRGANFERLGELDRACADFEAAMRDGDQSGRQNVQLYCATRR
jgi:putative inorganic carbon (hco3(-)) transporter